MLKRVYIYLQEMYPVLSRLAASAGLFAGIYLTALSAANEKLSTVESHILIGLMTVFLALLSLRIVDEFKDAETDKVHFPTRPLPSGRVKRSDLSVLLGVTVAVMIVTNFLYMPNWPFFVALFTYGCLMSVWFFARKYIQPNLVLALVTHNPFQLLLVFYVISIAASDYGFSPFTVGMFMVAFIFYLPALAWEISRKIRAPKDEDRYVTYSQVFGRRRAIGIVLVIMLVQLGALLLLFWGKPLIVQVIAGLAILSYLIYFGASVYAMRHSDWINYGKITRAYMYVFQPLVIVISAVSVV